ncbi:MAG: helix-turn-helix transcriptional regulator [Rhodospirillaceae bacterium]|nr:helix-turn-helix transcriptional regulator [Rhodospirillaceae bacterium]
MQPWVAGKRLPVRAKKAARPSPALSPAELGLRLRMARRSRGLTLKRLAERAGCSESLLSKVETGRNLPSLPLLHRLVQVLETNIGWIFGGHAPSGVVFRAGERPVVSLDPRRRSEGISLERVVPYGDEHLLQCNIHHIAEGGSSAAPIAHDGEEMGYVLSGRVELTVDGETYRLGPGDAFVFRSDLPHTYRNIGRGTASIIWVNTPPTF